MFHELQNYYKEIILLRRICSRYTYEIELKKYVSEVF